MPKAMMLYIVRGDKGKLLDAVRGGPMTDLLTALHSYYLESKERQRARAVRAWMNSIRNERLSLKPMNYPGNSAELVLEYDFVLKYPSSLGSVRSLRSVVIPVSHFVWVRRASRLLVFFDVFKKGALRALAEAISLKAYGDPQAIRQLSLSFDDFESLEAWATGAEGAAAGFVRRAVFADSVLGESHVDEISVKRAALEREPIYKSVKERSRRWLSLTLVTPLIEEVGARFSCRFSHDGSVIIYTPVTDLVQVDALLTNLERVLALAG